MKDECPSCKARKEAQASTPLLMKLTEAQKSVYRDALTESDWKVSVAARKLGVAVGTFRNHAIKFGLWPKP